MTAQNRRILMTVLISVAILGFLILNILYVITKEFVLSACIHIYFSLLYTPLILYWITRGLKNREVELNKRINWLCGIAVFLDLVVVDGIRYVLSGGIQTILFIPACAPFCAMLMMPCSTKKDNQIEKKTTLWICIPLLILSLYFEILSFLQL